MSTLTQLFTHAPKAALLGTLALAGCKTTGEGPQFNSFANARLGSVPAGDWAAYSSKMTVGPYEGLQAITFVDHQSRTVAQLIGVDKTFQREDEGYTYRNANPDDVRVMKIVVNTDPAARADIAPNLQNAADQNVYSNPASSKHEALLRSGSKNTMLVYVNNALAVASQLNQACVKAPDDKTTNAAFIEKYSEYLTAGKIQNAKFTPGQLSKGYVDGLEGISTGLSSANAGACAKVAAKKIAANAMRAAANNNRTASASTDRAKSAAAPTRRAKQAAPRPAEAGVITPLNP